LFSSAAFQDAFCKNTILEAILYETERASDGLGNASKTIERVLSVIDIEPTVPTVETQAHRKPSINRIPALPTTRSGGSSEKITASPHAVPSTPQTYCHGNNTFCRTPRLVRLTLPVLRSLRGGLEPPTHRSSLGATRAYVQSALLSHRLASSWTYRDPFHDVLVGIHH
jgi:hypothetical protein